MTRAHRYCAHRWELAEAVADPNALLDPPVLTVTLSCAYCGMKQRLSMSKPFYDRNFA